MAKAKGTTNTEAEVITPASAAQSQRDVTVSTITTNLAFNEKVSAVDVALKERTTAKKAIKTSWGRVVLILQEYDMDVPARRWEVSRALNEVRSLIVHLPQDPKLNDEERVKEAKRFHYEGERILDNRAFTDYLEEKFPGIKADLIELQDLYQLSNKNLEEDKEKTKEGREKLRAAIREYIDAVERFDETVESVADVREYINVVKDVAEISAIANGTMANNSN